MGGGENFPKLTVEPHRATVYGLSMHNSLPLRGVRAVVDKHDVEMFHTAMCDIEKYPDRSHEFRDVRNTSAGSGMVNLGSGPGDVAQDLNLCDKDNLGLPEGTGSRASSLSLFPSIFDFPRATSPFSISASAPAIPAIPELPLILPSSFYQYPSGLALYGGMEVDVMAYPHSENWSSPTGMHHYPQSYSSIPAYSPQASRYSPQTPLFTPQVPSYSPEESGNYSPQTPDLNPQAPSYCPQSPIFSPQAMIYSPQSPVFTPQAPKYSPQFANFIPQAPSYRPQSPVFTPQTMTYCPQSPVFFPQGTTESRAVGSQNRLTGSAKILDLALSSKGLEDLKRTQDLWISTVSRYLDLVKAEFADEPDKYQDFLRLVQGFKADENGVSELIRKVRESFDGKPALLEELELYLPHPFEDDY